MAGRRKARLQPCPSARPGVQAEGRLRGEPAAGLQGPATLSVLPSPKLGGSRSEARRGRSPKPRTRDRASAEGNGARPRDAKEGCKEPARPVLGGRCTAGRAVEWPPARSARRGGPVGAASAAGPSPPGGRSRCRGVAGCPRRRGRARPKARPQGKAFPFNSTHRLRGSCPDAPDIAAGRLVCAVVPPVGLEPTLLSEPDFESGASTNSATGAAGVGYTGSGR
jgi:hypothetical protein